eukprot:1603720-Prorocentrum_lima.AAC.1
MERTGGGSNGREARVLGRGKCGGTVRREEVKALGRRWRGAGQCRRRSERWAAGTYTLGAGGNGETRRAAQRARAAVRTAARGTGRCDGS